MGIMSCNNKKIIFSDHAKQRALERLHTKYNNFCLLFESELKTIFSKARKTQFLNEGESQYEYNDKNMKITFICKENHHEILIKTILTKKI